MVAICVYEARVEKSIINRMLHIPLFSSLASLRLFYPMFFFLFNSRDVYLPPKVKHLYFFFFANSIINYTISV